MKCEISLEKLKQAVTLTEKTAGKKTSLPVLSCILIEINKKTAIFKSTNLDVGIEVEIPVKTNEEGIFAVPAHTLSLFLSQVENREQIVSLDSVSGNLNIVVGKSKGVIKTLPPEDFPAIPVVTDGQTAEIPTDKLVKGLKAVGYSAAVSNVKPELGSIYIYHEADTTVLAATDSFRLAEKKIILPKTAVFEDLLIPFKNSLEIARVLESVGVNALMKANKNLVSFEVGGVRITSRIINGVFPDYKQIIPKSFLTEAVVLKQDLINALKVGTVFSDSFNQVRLSIDPKKKVFAIDTKNADVGENHSEIDAAITGEEVEVSFNAKYISDSFQSIEADSLSLQFNGRNKPMVIRPVSGDQTFMYLVMPMNR